MGHINLPPELIDIIIDHLHDDTQSLQTCSIVCHSWTAAARYHLFADLNLHGSQSLTRLSKSGSVVIPFVRNVHVTGNPYANYTHPLPFFRFVNVRSLSLIHLPWCAIDPETRYAFLDQFASIVRLHISQTHSVTSSQLEHIFDAFPSLETLIVHVSSSSSRANFLPSTIPMHPPCRLHALELWDPESHMTLKWLLSFEQSLPPLHTFYLHQLPSEDAPDAHDTLNRFLQALGPSLEIFRYIPSGYDRPLDLRRNTRLRSLHFDFWDGSPGLTRWLIHTLSDIAEKPIEHVGFTISLHPDHGTGPDWNEVDVILTEPPLAAKLRRVDIGHVCWTNARGGLLPFHAWGMVHLPRCHARGILWVHSVEWRSTFL